MSVTPVGGLHHITAIAGPAQENLDFYAGVLGMRLVKKSVNQDDPGTYHLFYADAEGHPGTDLTFFPWAHLAPPRAGHGLAVEVGARRAARQPRLLGDATRALRRACRHARDPLRRAHAAARRSARSAPGAGREPDVAARGRSRRGTTARFPSNIRSADFTGHACWERDRLPTGAVSRPTSLGFRELGREGGWTRFGVDAGGSGEWSTCAKRRTRRGAWGVGSDPPPRVAVDDDVAPAAPCERASKRPAATRRR